MKNRNEQKRKEIVFLDRIKILLNMINTFLVCKVSDPGECTTLKAEWFYEMDSILDSVEVAASSYLVGLIESMDAARANLGKITHPSNVIFRRESENMYVFIREASRCRMDLGGFVGLETRVSLNSRNEKIEYVVMSKDFTDSLEVIRRLKTSFGLLDNYPLLTFNGHNTGKIE